MDLVSASLLQDAWKCMLAGINRFKSSAPVFGQPSSLREWQKIICSHVRPMDRFVQGLSSCVSIRMLVLDALYQISLDL